MRVSEPGVSLRPLGLGEILDRAVTLCVRFFVPLASIYVWYAVPLGVVSFFSSQGLTRVVSMVTDAARGGHAASMAQIMLAAQSQPGEFGWALATFAFALFVAPLPTAALIEAATAYYLGRAMSVGGAYRIACDRYPSMLGITLLFIVAAVASYLALIVLGFVVAFVFVALAAIAKTAAVVLGIVVGIVAFVVSCAIFIALLFAMQIAYFTCVTERAHAFAAIGRAMKRVFSGIGLKRTLLVGLVYLAIAAGIAIVTTSGQAIIIGLLRSPVVGTIYQTIVRLATAAFTTAFVAIFYLDLRVREEGLDLQLATDRAELPATLRA